LSKEWAAHNIAGLPKVRVIKNVEEFSSELEAKPVADFRRLRDRKIRVVK